MRGWIAAVTLLAIGCAARSRPNESPSAAAGAPRVLADGVYTQEQSRRGQAIYFRSCVRCHKAELTGSQIVPPISGEPFLARWSRKTAGDLFEWVRTSMPPFETERLSRQESIDVLAYILSRNEFPAGEAELPADFDVLRMIRVAADPDNK